MGRVREFRLRLPSGIVLTSLRERRNSEVIPDARTGVKNER